MSLLTVVQDVCLDVGVQYPASVFSNLTTNRTMQEMLKHANEMAQRIAHDTREWTKLKAEAVFVGDGVVGTDGVMRGTTAFNLPANYQRMLLSSNVWRSNYTQTPMRFIPDTDEWTQRRARNYTDPRSEWTMYGGQIHIVPIMAVGINARFVYLDKNCIDLASGGRGDRFLTDADGFTLDERLLKLGMIWQWRASKGSPYGEDMGTYGDALATASGADKPSPIIIGHLPLTGNVTTALPWSIP
jgi:hypothetical protein